MTIQIYSLSNCSYCKRAKELLTINNLSYKELVVGVDISREDVVNKFPGRKELPIIEIDGQLIGGYADLIDYLNPPL